MDELIHELRSYAHQRLFDGSEKYDQHLLYLADQIEEEMANYVEFPKDADGEPWHIGDLTGRGCVTAFHFVNDDWLVELENEQWELADSIVHVHPDSWERIISDATALGAQMKRRTYQIGDFVERCKRLAGEE